MVMFLKRLLSRNGTVMALRQEIASGMPRPGTTQFVVAVYRIVYGLGYGDGEPAVCCRRPRTALICSALFQMNLERRPVFRLSAICSENRCRFFGGIMLARRL